MKREQKNNIYIQNQISKEKQIKNKNILTDKSRKRFYDKYENLRKKAYINNEKERNDFITKNEKINNELFNNTIKYNLNQ